MTLFLVAQLLSFIFSLMMIVRVWRASTLDGVLTLFVPFYFIIALIKYWHEPDHDIRWHSAAAVLFSAISVYGLMQASDESYAEEAVAYTPSGATDADSRDDNSNEGHDADDSTDAVAAAPSTPAEELSYADAARRAVFNRGRWVREATGFRLDVPSKFRLVGTTDAHRLDRARGKAQDVRTLAWILHETVPLTDPDSWYIRMRWHPDGWIAAAPIDPVQMLQTAQNAKETTSRLSSSGGDLVGYARAPEFDGKIVDWAEERVLADSDTHVVDCHALRLGLRGSLEFSITGMTPTVAPLCHASVRLLAERAQFISDREYPASAPAQGLHAAYSLAALITQTR